MSKLFLICLLLFVAGCAGKKENQEKEPAYIKKCYDAKIFETDLFGRIGDKKERLARINVSSCWIKIVKKFNLDGSRKEKISVLGVKIEGAGQKQKHYFLEAKIFLTSDMGSAVLINDFDRGSFYFVTPAYVLEGSKEFELGEGYAHSPSL